MSVSTIRGPLVLAGLCAVLVYVVFLFLGERAGAAPYLLILFFALSSLGGRALHGMARDPKQAVRSSMTAMALKMMASLLVLVVVIFATARERVLLMALTFGGLYLIFLVYDTATQFRAMSTPRP